MMGASSRELTKVENERNVRIKHKKRILQVSAASLRV